MKLFSLSLLLLLTLSFNINAEQTHTQTTKAYLQITLKISEENRANAAGVYQKYKAPFLKQVNGAKSKDLLIRDEDVQVLHGFESLNNAKAYLKHELFKRDVVRELKPLLSAEPEIKIFSVL